ncbi:hypothetical protein PMM47T1_20208, partial [Pseudomonas sp. M47T1]|uniref:hypothetical protein n=1 Tax=Pseudomonas sp. M47T1 TaxID=1179778 RepID=UPI000260687A
VKVSVPGNPDPDPSTPYINEDLLPPTGIPAVIDAASAVDLTLGIPRYENLHAGDVITLYWTGISVTHTVTAAEASTPTLPLNIVVSADIIRANPGLALVVNYDIRDVVKNWSLFSLSTHTDVEAPGGLLAPAVRDADDADVLDVDGLGGGDVAIWVPVNGNLAVGDQGVLTWVGQPVLGSQVTYTQPFVIAQAATRLTLYVPNGQAAALVGSTASVYYDVNGRRSSRASVSLIGQPVTLALPHLTNVTPPDYNPDLIPGSTQEVIVPAYAFMAVGQRVTLVWDGTSASGGNVYDTFERDIQSQSQVGRDISFQVDKNLAAALAGGSLKVSYKVAVGGQEYASLELELNVVGQVNTLPAPETDPVFANGFVDPNLIGNSLDVVIKPNGVLQPGDEISVHWHGLPNQSYNVEVDFPAAGNLVVPIAKDPFVLGNVNNLVEVWYAVRRNGVIFGSSRKLTLNIGEASQQPWPAPSVMDGTGGNANPWSPIKPGTNSEENTATVAVNDARLAPGDVVGVVWFLPDGTYLAILWFTVSTAGQARIPIAREFLAQSLGQTIRVDYVVFRGDDVVGTSLELSLTVLALPSSVLPTPAINEAVNDELDVQRLLVDATATVAAWPFMTTGQLYWLEARGTLADGSATVIPLASAQPVTSLSGVTRSIPLARLQALRDGSALMVEMSVAFAGDAGATVTFPLRHYVVRVELPLTLTVPYVVEADPLSATLTTSTLNTMKDVSGATVQIPLYGGMQIGDRVSFFWQGTAGAGTVSLEQTVERLAEMSFRVPYSALSLNYNRNVSLSFTVTKPSGASQTSSVHRLYVYYFNIAGECHITQGGPFYMACTVASDTVTVPSNLANGSTIVSSSRSGTGGYSVLANHATRFKINHIGSQPVTDATIASTGIKGIAMRLYFPVNSPSPEKYFVADLHGAAGSWDPYPSWIEFVKVGPVETGTIPAGPVVTFYIGANRMVGYQFSLTKAVTFIAGS